MNESTTNNSRPLTLHAEALPYVQALFKPNPWIYWIDFSISTAIGWFCFVMALNAEAYTWAQAGWFVASSLSLYRSVIFIHEIAHFRSGTFPVFRAAWNLFAGFPLLVPSFSYTSVHLNHHRRNAYGREEDGEYLPFVQLGHLFTVWFALSAMFMPAVFVIRCLVLTPLSFLFPPLQRWSWKHLSSLAIDLKYERPDPKPEEVPTIRLQEVATLLYWGTFLGFVASGLIPVKVLGLWYAMAVFVFFLNAVRTLAAHRYANSGSRAMTVDEQFLDSIDISGNPYVTPLWAPVGLRWHATHHLFPAIPYHNLGKARRCLEANLAQNKAVYQKSHKTSLLQALKELWVAESSARAAAKATPAVEASV